MKGTREKGIPPPFACREYQALFGTDFAIVIAEETLYKSARILSDMKPDSEESMEAKFEDGTK